MENSTERRFYGQYSVARPLDYLSGIGNDAANTNNSFIGLGSTPFVLYDTAKDKRATSLQLSPATQEFKLSAFIIIRNRISREYSLYLTLLSLTSRVVTSTATN